MKREVASAFDRVGEAGKRRRDRLCEQPEIRPGVIRNVAVGIEQGVDGGVECARQPHEAARVHRAKNFSAAKPSPVAISTMPAQTPAVASARLPSTLPSDRPSVVEMTDANAIATSDTYSGAPMYKMEKPMPRESRLMESAATNRPQPCEGSKAALSVSRSVSTIMYMPMPTSAAKPMKPATDPSKRPTTLPTPTPTNVIVTSADAKAAPMRTFAAGFAPRMPTPTQTAKTSSASET